MLSYGRKPTLPRALWAAAPLAACLAGCCKTAAVVPPDDLSVAAQRRLESVLNGLGKDDPNGKVSTSFRKYAEQEGQKPIAGLGLSMNNIVERAVFKEHGLYAAFTIDNHGKTIGRLASFLNGPTSPLKGWKGWRYRSGIIDSEHEPANHKVEAKLSLSKEALEAVPSEKTDVKQAGAKPAEATEVTASPVPQAPVGDDDFDRKEIRSLGGRSIYVVIYEETPLAVQVQR